MLTLMDRVSFKFGKGKVSTSGMEKGELAMHKAKQAFQTELDKEYAERTKLLGSKEVIEQTAKDLVTMSEKERINYFDSLEDSYKKHVVK